ncbi:MAG: selenocysteine-specific translation elongation factor [Micromonosporaceae bacterium]
MHVVATAGHVDHGKSTLVRALTGMEPDRWAEERRRGLTIDLGFAWTDLPSGQTVAFVDVPGHERFVPNMLAGVGPAPAAMVVVAADGGWMPQSAEHLAALDALDVRHGLLVVTRADLADPALAMAQAREQLAATSLRGVEAVAVSAVTGAGLDDVRAALDRLVAGLPPPVLDGPVRLWVDRSFTIRGAGTVITGTLTAGQLHVGDTYELAGQAVKVRGLQSLGSDVDHVTAVARVAVNLRGIDRDRARRGDALVTPGGFPHTDVVDVRVAGDPVATLPRAVSFHIGAAAVTARIRPLGDDTARLRLSRPLPLHVGDRALLRDPGRRHVAGAALLLDVAPPPLARRGAAARRAAVLADLDHGPDEVSELRRRRLARRGDLERMGVPVRSAPVGGDWLADPGWWQRQRQRLREQVDRYAKAHPLQPDMPVEALRQALDLPDRNLVAALVSPPLLLTGGRVGVPGVRLPAQVSRAAEQIRTDLADRRFRAPDAARLAELGLTPQAVAAAVRARALTSIADGIVLAPGAPEEAVAILRELPQPFTISQARQALDTTRRVAVPLLELLDREGLTRRLPDDRRTVTDHLPEPRSSP